ncbi:MAG: hypothetical protein E7384_08690 [Ruminococcaceae bacterium]|nr:hypothetical protein [Oscillospiraceae bacterium]
MKDKKSLKIRIAVIVAAVIYITVSVVLGVVFWNDDEGLIPGVKIYGLTGIGTEESVPMEINGLKLITNGVNNSVYYTSPELDLGYLSESDLYGSDTEYYSPAIVVGEGKYADNGTVVRIYNEKQVCTAQFSAFPSSVKGGVLVAAGRTVIDGKNVTLIATAAYGAFNDDARCVRVYDSHGMLYMKIIPEFYAKAPFTIATGHFIKGDSSEYLLVSESVIKDGKIQAVIYSLSDGSVKGEYVYDLGKENDEKNVSVSVRNKADGNDKIILFAESPKPYKNKYFNIEEEVAPEEKDTSDMYAVFEGDATGLLEKVDMVLPYGATGVYSSSEFGEKYIVTANNEFFENDVSYVYVYGYGEKNGTLRYVDYEEKRFYWNADKSVNDVEALSLIESSFVSYADELEMANSEDVTKLIKKAERAAEFAYWKVKLAGYGIEPAKAVYDALTAEYRRSPSSVVSMEIFSTTDVLSGVTLSDSGEEIRAAFAEYLLNLYGNIDNINKKFGASFSSIKDINIPKTDEASFDLKNDDYYRDWYRFTRYRVGKRITALYGAAISSGLPPALVTCDAELSDYLPEESDAADYNIENKYYIDGLSIIPESVMYNVGASLGLSRVGVWYTNPRHAVSLAFSAGFKDITLSSYSSGTDSYEKSFYQLLYMYRNGCKYVGIESANPDYAVAELNAIELLLQRDTSRNSYATGTAGVRAVMYNGKKYNIVTLGSSSNGLLKSVDKEGKREGSVYSVPFHSDIQSEGAKVHNNPRKGLNTATFHDLAPGSSIEVRFVATGGKTENSYVKVNVYHDGFLLEDACISYKLDDSDKYYRYVFKNDLELGSVKIEIECVCEDYTEFKLNDVDVILQRENNIYPAADDYKGSSSAGGITMDILDRDALYEEA